MAPVENQKTNIESIIPPDARDRLIDLQKMIESSKNIDTSKKTVFAMLDTLAGDHPEFKQYYEDIKEYIRFEQAKNVKAIRAEVQAQQDQLRSYSSSHTRSAPFGEEKTGGTYNISVPDRTNQGVDAAGRPTADYGKMISGNSGSESFNMASVERGRQLFNQIRNRSVDMAKKNTEMLVSPTYGSITVPNFNNQRYREMITKDGYNPFIVGTLVPSQHDADSIRIMVASQTPIILHDQNGNPIEGTLTPHKDGTPNELINQPIQFPNGYWGIPIDTRKEQYVLVASVDSIKELEPYFDKVAGVPSKEQIQEKENQVIELLSTPISVALLKNAVETIENQTDMDQKILHASFVLSKLREQQYEIAFGRDNSIAVMQNIDGKYESNVDFTSVLSSSKKIDVSIWRQAVLMASPKFSEYIDTKTDTQGNLKDPNLKSEEFINYLVLKYKLSQPLKLQEISDIKREPGISPADKSILISRANGGIPADTPIHTSAQLRNELVAGLADTADLQGLAKFMDNSALVNALNGGAGKNAGNPYEKWGGFSKEFTNRKDFGDFLTRGMNLNPGGTMAIYALLVGFITWGFGAKDGKFSRFFLSAILLPFAPAAFGGIKNIIYGDDPDADKKIGKFVSDMMKNESDVVKNYFNTMIPPESPYIQQIAKANSLADTGKSTKKFLSYQEHINLLGSTLLDKPVSSLFIASNSNETLWSGESSVLPEGFKHDRVHGPTMKALLRQLLIGEQGNPTKVMNANALTTPTIAEWLTKNKLDQEKLATMTLRQLVAHIANNKPN